MNLVRLTAVMLLFGIGQLGATVIYTYDFPGSPPNGAASNQTHSQPANATFSDFTRNGPMQGGTANIFESNNWSTNPSIDLAVYVGFSITADSGFHLDLTSLAFDTIRSAAAGTNGEVALFINGSATPYATQLFTPTTVLTTVNFNFAALTESDNATTAEFRFYGWNTTGPGERLSFDNVTTNGTITNAPEPSGRWSILLPVSLILGSFAKAFRGQLRLMFTR
jgi:hypothetical protein